MHDKLLYGKTQLSYIVGLEIQDDYTELFLQDQNGEVTNEFLNNRFWILAPYAIDEGWTRLKGDLHYKFGKQFKTLSDFISNKQYYKNKDIFYMSNPKESFMVKDGYTYYQEMKHNEVTILSFDIEATSLEYNPTDLVLLISNTFRRNGEVTRKLFSYKDYQNQRDMIDAWCSWVKEMNPSIICGHNIYGYDLPYLSDCASYHSTSLHLGRDGSNVSFDNYESKFRKDGSQFYHYKKVKCYGRELIDTMFLAIKYDIGRKYESYGLKKIIEHEGLEVKDRVFYDAQQIRFTYTDPKEWEKIKQYATHDGDDALALYDLMAPSFFYLTQSIPKSFQGIIESASGSQINSMMIRSYLQEGHSIPKTTESKDFEGAISFGNPGIYRNVFKVDVASLYPSIMLQYEIFDKIKDPNGNLLKILKTFTEERLKNKVLAKTDKYFDDLQNAQKIVINSMYGFMGATGLAFNYPKGASEVTRYGREILKRAIKWAEDKGFEIVNGDTDSISFLYYQGFTEDERRTLLRDLNEQYPKMIHWEDDGYYPTVIIAAAKNYALYDGKKIKFKGSAFKDSKKELALKEFMQSIIKTIIDNKSNYTEIYNLYVKEILNVTDIKRWASKKTITDKVLNAARTNEQKILDAISNSNYNEGDKIWVFFKSDNSLNLIENFDGDYNEDKLLEKLWKTVQIFDKILDVPTYFKNYKLKKNKKLLEQFNETEVLCTSQEAC